MDQKKIHLVEIDAFASPNKVIKESILAPHDHNISDDAKLFSRYVDDGLWSIHKNQIDEKLAEINRLHPSLRFTIEVEENDQITFLDMNIIRSEQKLTSTLYSKPTNTGPMMKLHFLAPIQTICCYWHDSLCPKKNAPTLQCHIFKNIRFDVLTFSTIIKHWLK